MKRSDNWIRMLAMGLVCLVLMTQDYTHAESLNSAAVSAAKEKLSQISQEEKGVLKELFDLSSKIEGIETQIDQTSRAIDRLQGNIRDKEKLIDGETQTYEKTKDSLARVLRVQQRAGAASAVEIILNAKNLKDLIHRINLLRDLSKNTSELMDRIEATRVKLTQEQQALSDMLAEQLKQQRTLQAAYESKNQAKLELEAYLRSLESEKSFYEDHLLTLEKLWNSLKPLFSDTMESLKRIIETGALPADTIEMTTSLFSAKGRIGQEKFNGILSSRKDLPDLKFIFHQDAVILEFPDYQIRLVGQFRLVDGKTIQYAVTGGTFYGMPLSRNALLDLFSEGDLVFSMKALVGNNSIRRIDSHEGFIELLIAGS